LPQLKVWQLLGIGTLWIVAGLVLHTWVAIPSREVIQIRELVIEVDTSWSHYVWNAVLGFVHETQILVIGPCAIGIRCWWLGIRALRVHDLTPVPADDDEIAAPEPARPERRLRRVLPRAPRLGDDPFRDPPRPPAIIVARRDAAAAPTPVVVEGPGDEPKLLS
jgi:hypothetical protein